MIKKIFWLILLANLGLFAFMRWGEPFLRTDASLQMQPPLNPDKIKLLGFTAARAGAASAAASAPPPTPQPPVPAPPPPVTSAPASVPPAMPTQSACLEWGEFSGSDLSHATANLAGLKLGDGLSQREVEHSIGYWVYIPPGKTHADMNSRIAQLKKAGIHDYFVVKEKGKWQNTISLGVFKGEDVAHRFLASLKAKGVKSAVMGERQTRLKFTVFILKNPNADTLSKLVEWQKGFTDIGMKAVPCNQAPRPGD